MFYGTGVPVTASATLSGPTYMTGTITFVLRDPSGAVVDTETATVNGPGTYSTPRARYLVLVVDPTSPRPIIENGAGGQQVWLGSRPAELSNQPDGGVMVLWQQEGLRLEATLEPAQGAPEVPRSELLVFLSTLD